jgi:hypothetical protein
LTALEGENVIGLHRLIQNFPPLSSPSFTRLPWGIMRKGCSIITVAI